MWYKVLLSIIVIALIVIAQVTFFGSFNTYWSSFNLILAILVILIFLTDFNNTMFFVIVAGVLLDTYSSLPYGIFLVSLFVAAVSCKIVFSNILTNRSFYSVMLMGLVSLVSFYITFLMVSGLSHFIGLSDFYINGRYFIGMLYTFINTLIILAMLFGVVHSLSRSFKPNFIRS